MDYTKIKEQLIDHEALKLKLYRCTANKLTIGVGHNIEDNGISYKAAMFILGEDIDECFEDLKRIFKHFENLPENIQHVLIDMRFQLGYDRFRGFRKMIIAVQAFNWREMVVQMKDSKWYRQTTNRADELIEMVNKEIRNKS